MNNKTSISWLIEQQTVFSSLTEFGTGIQWRADRTWRSRRLTCAVRWDTNFWLQAVGIPSVFGVLVFVADLWMMVLQQLVDKSVRHFEQNHTCVCVCVCVCAGNAIFLLWCNTFGRGPSYFDPTIWSVLCVRVFTCVFVCRHTGVP
jgi:hypothetical protein